jgi:hypothetical protein
MGIRDKARKASEGKGPVVDAKDLRPAAGSNPSKPKATEPKAPTTTTPKAEDKEQPKAETTVTKPASVTDIRDRMVDDLSEVDVEKFLARQASGPLVAGLAATRETKLNQVQYDGKTADGYVVRVWAPEGAEMLIKARLETVA